jgi:hypothetical protein
MFMDIRHIRSGSVSLSESRLLRFSLAPTPESKQDFPPMKVDLGATDIPLKGLDDVPQKTDTLVDDATKTLKGAGDSIAALTDKGLKFGKDQLGKFNEFVGKLNLPKKGKEVELPPAGPDAPEAPRTEKPLAEPKTTELTPVVPEQGGDQPEPQAEGKDVPANGLFLDISAADGKEIPLAGNGLPEGLTMNADVKNKTVTLRLGKSTETLAINANGQIDAGSIGEAVNKLKVAEGGKEKDGKAPEAEKKEPKTHRELLQRELDNANAILRSPEKKGMDKLMAGIQALGALKQMMDRAFKGTLDEPLGKKEDPVAAAKDGTKKNADADKDGSKDKDSGKDGDKEKGGSEKGRDADPETDEKRNQPSEGRRERLRDEMKDKKGGHKELLEEKHDQVEKSKDKVKAIDEKIDGLEERHDTLDDEQDADRTKLRNLEQELRGADEDDKGDLEEQITDLKEDMEMRDDEMKVLDKNRQKLLDRKERKQPKALEKDVKELEAMRADAEKAIETATQTLETLAQSLKDSPDLAENADAQAFAELVGGLNLQLDDATLGIKKLDVDGEVGAKMKQLSESTGVELPKEWNTDATVLMDTLQKITTAIVEGEKKPKAEEGKDEAGGAPAEESSDGGAEFAANHLREVADAQGATNKAIAELDQLVDVKGEPRYRDALQAVVDAVQYEQGVIKHDAEQIPLEQAQRLQEISALLPRYETELAELDAAAKKNEQNKDEAPDLNKEDAEKFSKWAKAIEETSNKLGYAVTVTAGKDGSMTIAPKGEYDETAAKTIDSLNRFASARGMTPVENDDHSLSINVQLKDEGKGYFGQVNEEFVQQFEHKVDDALDAAGKEKAVAEEKPAERGTPNPSQIDGDGRNAPSIA